MFICPSDINFIYMSAFLPFFFGSVANKIAKRGAEKARDNSSGDRFLKEVSSDPSGTGNISYEALYAMNPYRNYTYKRSWFQNLMSGLGLRTDADRYEEEMAMNAREYDANIALKEYNENFEDPVNEAQRLRNAGINSALSGLGDANQASPISPDDTPPSAMADDMNTIQGFSSSILNLAQMTIGFMGDLESLKSLRLANESGDMDNIGKMLGLANDLVFQSTSGEYHPDDDQAMYTLDYMNQVSGLFRSKRSRQRFARASSSALNNLPNTLRIAEARNKRGKERFDFAQLYQSGYYDEQDEFLMALVEPLSELNDKLLKLDKETAIAQDNADISSAENTQEYNEAFSPELSASAANAQNRETANSSAYQTELNSTMRGIVSKLSSLAERGNKFASVGLLLVQLFQSQFLANMARDVVKPQSSSNPAPRVNIYTR